MAFLNSLSSTQLEYPYDVNYCTEGDMEVEVVFRMETVTMTNSAACALVGVTAHSGSGALNATFGLAWYQGKLRIIHEYGSKVLYQSDTLNLDLGIEKWHHIKVQRVGLQYIIYQNNIEVERKNFTTTTKPSGINPNSTKLRIGYIYYLASNATTLAGRGSIVYVRCTALPQVQPLVYGTLPTVPTKPVFGGISNYGVPSTFEGATRIPSNYMGNSLKNIEDSGQYGKRLIRKNSGIEYEPKEGSSDSGGQAIIPPRRFPLETSWKKSNPSFFT